MPLMSRFRKDKQGDDDPLADIQEADDDEEEGLFMATKLTPGGAPAEDDASGDLDDLLETASAETTPSEDAAPAPDTAAEPEGGSDDGGEDGAGPAVQTASASPDDDALSLFRADAVESEAGELTKHVEDVPIEELLAELRELRAMLVSGPASVENESEGMEGTSKE